VTLSVFADKAHQPTEKDLRSVLGKPYTAWVELIELVSNRIPPILQAWSFTTGWSLRLKRKDRVIVYMTPRDGHFLVSFALGEKAVAAARASKLPATVLKAIESAPKYAEGRGVRFEVRQVRQVPPLAALAEIKNQN
jgi:uncharacterized protein DUF3788